MEQRTHYPLDGHIALHVDVDSPTQFELGLRIPVWACGAAVQVNGQPVAQAVLPGHYTCITRLWQAGDVVNLVLPMPPVLHHQRLQNVQESRAPDGSPVHQEVLRHDHVAITRGPLVYATGLIDGFKTEETIRLRSAGQGLELLPAAAGEAPLIRLWPDGRAPLDFSPYYGADGRSDGAWRLTWLSLAPH